MDLFTLIVGFLLLIMIVVSVLVSDIIKKAKKVTKQQTYSKYVDASLLEKGAFVEHGMVYDESNHEVKAQHKKSVLFYKSVF